jgi:hypothetical protein
MNEKNVIPSAAEGDDKWLDELISRTINTTKPEFESEKWKQKYHKELKTLVSHTEKTSTSTVRLSDILTVVRQVLKNPITKLAAAALIILAISFLMTHLGPSEKVKTTDVATAIKSPAEMQTILSLNIAYRRGGIEAVDRQCKKAIEMLGPRPQRITIKQILTEFNGT